MSGPFDAEIVRAPLGARIAAIIFLALLAGAHFL